jgi:pimeloyl-ACP methyl ester carboxylesterase
VKRLILASLVVLAIAAAPVAASPEKETPLPTPWSHWTEIGGSAVHYVDTAPGSALPVLLVLPGFLGSTDMFVSLAGELADGLRVVVVDLPGFGWSAPPGGGCAMQDRLAFVHAFVDRLGLGPFALAGSSLGANIAIHFALEEPDRVRRVVLLSPFGMAAQHGAVERLERIDRLLPVVALFVSRAFLARELENHVRDPGELTPAILDSYHRPFRTAAGRRVVVEVTRHILCGCTFDDCLPLLRQPVLVIAGTEDAFGSAVVLDDLAARLPACSPVRVDGGHHAIQLDATAEVARIIRSFCAPGGT